MAKSEPLIRPPLQKRSQESLDRVLQAGLEVIQEKGLDGFTLQEVSQRASVSVGSIYGRVASREALIMAVYEYAMAWTTEQDEIRRDAERDDLATRERIEALAADAAWEMLGHADVLSVFMRHAPMVPWILTRAAEKSQETAEVFTAAVLKDRDQIRHPEPAVAVDVAFRMVYCTTARRITHGPQFESARKVSDKVLVREMARAIADYLL